MAQSSRYPLLLPCPPSPPPFFSYTLTQPLCGHGRPVPADLLELELQVVVSCLAWAGGCHLTSPYPHKVEGGVGENHVLILSTLAHRGPPPQNLTETAHLPLPSRRTRAAQMLRCDIH